MSGKQWTDLRLHFKGTDLGLHCSLQGLVCPNTSGKYGITICSLMNLPSVYWVLTLSTLGKIFSRRHFEIFFLFFPENRI